MDHTTFAEVVELVKRVGFQIRKRCLVHLRNSAIRIGNAYPVPPRGAAPGCPSIETDELYVFERWYRDAPADQSLVGFDGVSRLTSCGQNDSVNWTQMNTVPTSDGTGSYGIPS